MGLNLGDAADAGTALLLLLRLSTKYRKLFNHADYTAGVPYLTDRVNAAVRYMYFMMEARR